MKVKYTTLEEFEQQNYLDLQNDVKEYVINVLLNTRPLTNKQLVALVGLLTYCKKSRYAGDNIGTIGTYSTKDYDLLLRKYNYDDKEMCFIIKDCKNSLIFKKDFKRK